MKTRLLVTFAVLAAIAWAVVGIQGNNAGASTPTLGANGGTINYGSSTAGASMLFVGVDSFQNSSCTISDTQGANSNANAWNALTLVTDGSLGGNSRLQTWYAYAKTGGGALVTGTSHSVTLACTSSFAAMTLVAATGTLITGDPIGLQAGGFSTTTATSGSISPTNGDLVIAVVGAQSGALALSSPWTQLNAISGGGYMSNTNGWLIAAGAQTATSTGCKVAKIVSFKAGPVGQPSIMMIQGEELK